MKLCSSHWALSVCALGSSLWIAPAHAQDGPPSGPPPGFAMGPSGQMGANDEPTTKAPTSLKVGDVAPDLKGVDWWDDKNFGGFEKNRVTLVHFWASSNAPSQRTLAQLKALKAQYADEGLEVVGVSVDDNADSAVQMLVSQGTHFDFFLGLDSKKTSWNTWNQGAGPGDLPTSFLVGADGKIAWIGRLRSIQKPLLNALADIPLDALPPRKGK